MYNLILFIQGVENLSWEQTYDMLNVLHLSTSPGSFLCLYRRVNIFVYMEKYLFEDVHKFSGHFGTVALGREAK